MRRALALASIAAIAAAIGGSASGKPVARTCPASPVDGEQVHAGVITGGIDPYTDVVDGRFRLHVGEYRDVASGIFQKILWWVPSARKGIGGQLVIRGRTLYGRNRTFVQKFQYAGTEDQTNRSFPSTIVPPSAGCWRLTLTTGKLRNALTVRVDAPDGCLAARVKRGRVHAGPFTGLVNSSYVENGRFRLHVGGKNKMGWNLPRNRAKEAPRLSVKGVLLTAPGGEFRDSLAEIFYAGALEDQHVYASNFKLPTEGCWRLTFKTRRLTGSLVVLVRDG
jgi:hypothetical protein